jgi:hypothetical protein
LPVEFVFYCAFENKYKAFEFEKYLKSGSGRALMQKDYFRFILNGSLKGNRLVTPLNN